MPAETPNSSLEKHFCARLSSYCIAHFLIDLASVVIVLGYIWKGRYDVDAYVIFYMIAFAGQMPLGLLADKLNRNSLVAVAGCVCMIIALGLMSQGGGDAFYAVVILGALGNALVHLGGGIDVINHSGPKSGPLGIFVSPGAIGLFVGGLAVRQGMDINGLMAAALAVIACVIVVMQKWSLGSMRSQNVPLSLRIRLPETPRMAAAAAVAALFIVVTVRSYVGLTLAFDWKTQWHWGVILLLGLVAGKALGGVLSDRFGIMRVAAVSLLAAAVCFAFPHVPVAGALAVFLFNMTMPMTLWALSAIFDRARGFAFGTLTLSLFLGFVITVVHPQPLLPMGVAYSIAAVLSLALLYFGLRPVRGRR